MAPPHRTSGTVVTRPRHGEPRLTTGADPETETGGVKRAVSPSLTLKMDAFGSEAFIEFAERQGGSASRVATMGANYYLADADHLGPGWPVPSFAQNVDPERRHVVRVALDDPTWNALVREARRQGVDISVLAAHAALYFMADVESGRVAQRMGRLVTEPRRR
jgi:hypothetical protein